MERVAGLGIARTVLALVVLGVLVAVGVLALGRPGAPAGPAATPTQVAADVSPSPTASDTSAPSNLATPTPTPTATEVATPSAVPSASPTDEPIAFTNPDGPPRRDDAPYGYAFIELANEMPTFAMIWVDDNQRDFHIAVTGDIEGAIAALRDSIPRGVTVYFHLAEHNQAELCELRDEMFDDREELMRQGIVLSGGGCGNIRNRVVVSMSPFTPEAVAFMQERYPGPVDYEYGGVSALRPYEPPVRGSETLTAVLEIADLDLLTCGRRPFPSSSLETPADPVGDTGPEDRALAEALELYTELYGDLSALTWIETEKDDFGATFLAQRGGDWLEAPVFAGVDGWVPGTIDDCTPRPFTTDDFGPSSWTRDPAYPRPGREATEVHALVTELACSGASSPAGRLVAPIVEYQVGRLIMTIGVRPAGGPQTCPGNPSFPVTIVLPEPLGDRELPGGSPTIR